MSTSPEMQGFVERFDALVASLGWVNAVRFIQAYESSNRDYTRERDQILPDWDPARMVREAQAGKAEGP